MMTEEEMEEYLNPQPMSILNWYRDHEAKAYARFVEISENEEKKPSKEELKKAEKEYENSKLIKRITDKVKRRFRNKSDWTHNEDDKDVRDFEIEADDLVGCIECNRKLKRPTKLSECQCINPKWVPDQCICGKDTTAETEKMGDDCTCGREVIPAFVATILVVRQRIKNGAREWIGYQPATGQFTGNMSMFISNVKQSLVQHLAAFESFVEHQVSREPAVLACFERDPHEEERDRLLRQEELILNAIREVEKLG